MKLREAYLPGAGLVSVTSYVDLDISLPVSFYPFLSLKTIKK